MCNGRGPDKEVWLERQTSRTEQTLVTSLSLSLFLSFASLRGRGNSPLPMRVRAPDCCGEALGKAAHDTNAATSVDQRAKTSWKYKQHDNNEAGKRLSSTISIVQGPSAGVKCDESGRLQRPVSKN